VPLFAVLIRAMKKLDSKCAHARFPWCFPVSIWGRCEWAITVPQSQSAEPGHADLIDPRCEPVSSSRDVGTNGIDQQFG
jgi:hypothetical protein